MGTTQAKPQSYISTHEGWCQKFGQVQYVSHPANEQFEGIRIFFDAQSVQQASQAWEKMIQYLQSEEEIRQLIVFPVSYGWDDDGSICDSQKTRKSAYEIIYNSFFTTLSNELKLRIEKKVYFSEQQVWYLGYCLLKVSSFFETHSWHLGNIHPKNIMIDKQGTVKVFTTFSSPMQRENYELIKESKYSDAFLAPEQIDSSLMQSKQVNKSKIDTYYIGLVMLSLTCLKDLYFVFDHCQSSIKMEALGELLLKMKRSRDKYSTALYSTIENMLENNPQERNTPQHYYQILKKYEKSIVQMNGIDFEQAKLEQFNFNHKHNNRKRTKHQQQITFLTLSKGYKQQALRTKQKISKFVYTPPKKGISNYRQS